MSEEISVRQWQEKYKAGAFNSKDTNVQRQAGWWNWHCRVDALAGRLKRIAPVVMGIKAPFILDNYTVWFINERTERKLVYDSVRFEPMEGPHHPGFFKVDFNDPCQPDRWMLYTKRFSLHAAEYSCGHVQDMVEYIEKMAIELEQGIKPLFLDEKAAAVDYILSRPVLYPSRTLRREGEHSYSFLDRDDGVRKTVHVARSLKETPSGFLTEQAKEINGLYVFCPEDAEPAQSAPERLSAKKSSKKKETER